MGTLPDHIIQSAADILVKVYKLYKKNNTAQFLKKILWNILCWAFFIYL
jgi:hypothetical protein